MKSSLFCFPIVVSMHCWEVVLANRSALGNWTCSNPRTPSLGIWSGLQADRASRWALLCPGQGPDSVSRHQAEWHQRRLDSWALGSMERLMWATGNTVNCSFVFGSDLVCFQSEWREERDKRSRGAHCEEHNWGKYLFYPRFRNTFG